MSWMSGNCKPVEKDGHGVWRIQEEQRQSTSYGMGFGPEGDGVELMRPYKVGDTLMLDTLTGAIKHYMGADLKPVKAVDATMRWVSPKRDDVSARHPAYQQGMEIGRAIRRSMQRDHCSFENIQWSQFTFETKEANAKPALPALTRQAGEKYKGLGFNDGMDQ